MKVDKSLPVQYNYHYWLYEIHLFLDAAGRDSLRNARQLKD
jgi:hypothetical protein